MNFFRLIKATRIERSLYSIGAMMTMIALADSFSFWILVLALNSTLLYCVAGLMNAVADNDFENLKNIWPTIIILMVIPIVTSFFNHYIALSTLLWFTLGLFYNYISRKIIFMDSFILGLTHVFIPSVISLKILGLDIINNILLMVILYFIYIGIINIKNINQKIDDTKRGYSTLLTKLNKGFELSIIIYTLSFFLMLLTPSLLGFKNTSYLLPSSLAMLYIPFFAPAFFGNPTLSVKLMRATWFFYLLIIIFEYTENIFLLGSSALLFLMHILFIREDIKKALSLIIPKTRFIPRQQRT